MARFGGKDVRSDLDLADAIRSGLSHRALDGRRPLELLVHVDPEDLPNDLVALGIRSSRHPRGPAQRNTIGCGAVGRCTSSRQERLRSSGSSLRQVRAHPFNPSPSRLRRALDVELSDLHRALWEVGHQPKAATARFVDLPEGPGHHVRLYHRSSPVFDPPIRRVAVRRGSRALHFEGTHRPLRLKPRFSRPCAPCPEPPRRRGRLVSTGSRKWATLNPQPRRRRVQLPPS
jgi:hypothetical protein